MSIYFKKNYFIVLFIIKAINKIIFIIIAFKFLKYLVFCKKFSFLIFIDLIVTINFFLILYIFKINWYVLLFQYSKQIGKSVIV
jgi:hypothetical protein